MPSKEAELTGSLKRAGQFDVHRWSEYPEVKAAADSLFREIVEHRRSIDRTVRIRDPLSIKKHMRVLLLNLYVASQSDNPWIGVSKNKSDYQSESRYRKIFLTYDFLVPLINILTDIGYIDQHKGFSDRKTGKGFRTRIRATNKLLEHIDQPDFGLKQVVERDGLVKVVTENPELERETIILRNAEKKNIEYEDTEETIRMRENLREINSALLNAHITLRINDEQFETLEERLKSSEIDNREHVDFTNKTLWRVFNEDFRHGGRFYGGWWIGLPKEYRKYIEIGYKETVEVDFSAHHIRILYANVGLVPPDDPYRIDGCPFSRDQIKQTFLILINATGRDSTIRACKDKGINQPENILYALEQKHAPISPFFYSGMGLELQFEDSMLAEEIMLKMLVQSGATVLPVHDSFIVRNSYEEELRLVMEEVFTKKYKVKPAMKTNMSILEMLDNKNRHENLEKKEIRTNEFVEMDLEELGKEDKEFSKHYSIWGRG